MQWPAVVPAVGLLSVANGAAGHGRWFLPLKHLPQAAVRPQQQTMRQFPASNLVQAPVPVQVQVQMRVPVQTHLRGLWWEEEVVQERASVPPSDLSQRSAVRFESSLAVIQPTTVWRVRFACALVRPKADQPPVPPAVHTTVH